MKYLHKLLTISTQGSISIAQYPDLSQKILLDYFYNEIKYQNHSTLKRSGDIIYFTVTPFSSKFLRSRNKFNNYSEAELKISKQDNFLVISFIGFCLNGLYKSLILPSFIFILGFCVAVKNGSFGLLIIPIILFPILSGLILLLENISIQFYISNKINRIREKLRDHEPIA